MCVYQLNSFYVSLNVQIKLFNITSLSIDRSGFVDHRRIGLLNIAVGQTEALFILTQKNKKSKIKRFFLPQAISFLRKAFNSRENENFYCRYNANKTKGYASALTSLLSVAGASEAFHKSEYRRVIHASSD